MALPFVAALIPETSSSSPSSEQSNLLETGDINKAPDTLKLIPNLIIEGNMSIIMVKIVKRIWFIGIMTTI